MIRKSDVIAALKALGFSYTNWDVEEIQKLYKLRVTGIKVDRQYLEALIREYYTPHRYQL